MDGQALVELALVLPLLMVLLGGVWDIGHSISLRIEASRAARAGMRAGLRDGWADIGSAVRKEPGSSLANTLGDWGSAGPLGPDAVCTAAAPSCGDPAGCSTTSPFWATPGQSGGPLPRACFAVRWCAQYVSGQCEPGQWSTDLDGGAWGRSRPLSGQIIDIRVVYRYSPAVPLLGSLFGDHGDLIVSREALGLVSY